MPHVTLTLWPGQSEEVKQKLADAFARDLMEIAGSSSASISVAIDEVAPEDWRTAVYAPEIAGRQAGLYKAPGYDPADLPCRKNDEPG